MVGAGPAASRERLATTLFPFEDLRQVTTDRRHELRVLANSDLLQTFIAGRVLDENSG